MADSNCLPKKQKYIFNKNIFGNDEENINSANKPKELDSVVDPRIQTYKLVDLDFNGSSDKEQLNETAEKSKSVIHKGDTDSSDDEDNRNVFESKLNDYGKSIKKMIYKKPEKSSNTNTSNISLSVPKHSFKAKKEDSNEEIFGIYIKNPTIPLRIIRGKIEGKQVVSIAQIKSFLSLESKNDWIISGVIISKSPVKQSKNGDNFSIWKLSDLKSNLQTITLFLFRVAHNEHWKCAIGSVIGILNPSKFENRDKNDEATLFIDNPERLINLGESRDFGLCISRTKNGKVCTNFVNLKTSAHCIFHLQQEYKKCSRSANPNFLGNHLDNLKKKVLGKNEVFYAGRSFSANNQTKIIPAKDKERLQNLSMSKNVAVLPNLNKSNSLINPSSNAKVQQSTRERDNEKLKLLQSLSKPCSSNQEDLKLNLKSTPKLGEFTSINIDISLPLRSPNNSKAKLKALEFVKKNGPITSPNLSVKAKRELKRKRNTSPKRIEKKIKKDEAVDEEGKEAFIKKFKAMLEKSSQYTELVDQKDAESQENYFQKLEKKEFLEEKMLSVFQMPCKAVKCLTCKYESFSAADRCKEERHNIKVYDAVKRFFQCAVCGYRTISLKILPLTSCKKCQNSSWKKAPMIKEKIQTLDTQLSIRGGEEKFIGAAVTNANINLNVPDE